MNYVIKDTDGKIVKVGLSYEEVCEFLGVKEWHLKWYEAKKESAFVHNTFVVGYDLPSESKTRSGVPMALYHEYDNIRLKLLRKAGKI